MIEGINLVPYLQTEFCPKLGPEITEEGTLKAERSPYRTFSHSLGHTAQNTDEAEAGLHA